MNIIEATQQHAPVIANLIMMAMTDECCLNLAGEGRTVADFARLMTQLTAADDTQYSYRNTLLAVTDEGEVAGAIVSYDGAKLHELREAFIEGARREFGVDHSGMDDETAAGEWYLDSLAVFPLPCSLTRATPRPNVSTAPLASNMWKMPCGVDMRCAD